MLKRRMGLAVFLLCNATLVDVIAAECTDALVKDTWSSAKSRLRDWRLAQFLTKDQWDEARSKGGGNAVINGVPVGGSFEDFRSRVNRMQQASQESLSEQERENILWTGIGNGGTTAYIACLNAAVFSRHGLHAGVVSAQEHDVTVRLTWDLPPETIPLQWSGSIPADVANQLPTSIKRGERSIVLPRPASQYTLVANGHGWSTEPIVITPLTPTPPIPDVCKESWNSDAQTYQIKADSMCRQRVTWNAYGAFQKGCDTPDEAAIVQISDSTGKRTLNSWHDNNFDNSSYSGLSGSTEIEPGEQSIIELVRTASTCSNPAGPIGMHITVVKHHRLGCIFYAALKERRRGASAPFWDHWRQHDELASYGAASAAINLLFQAPGGLDIVPLEGASAPGQHQRIPVPMRP